MFKLDRILEMCEMYILESWITLGPSDFGMARNLASGMGPREEKILLFTRLKLLKSRVWWQGGVTWHTSLNTENEPWLGQCECVLQGEMTELWRQSYSADKDAHLGRRCSKGSVGKFEIVIACKRLAEMEGGETGVVESKGSF